MAVIKIRFFPGGAAALEGLAARKSRNSCGRGACVFTRLIRATRADILVTSRRDATARLGPERSRAAPPPPVPAWWGSPPTEGTELHFSSTWMKPRGPKLGERNQDGLSGTIRGFRWTRRAEPWSSGGDAPLQSAGPSLPGPGSFHWSPLWGRAVGCNKSRSGRVWTPKLAGCLLAGCAVSAELEWKFARLSGLL